MRAADVGKSREGLRVAQAEARLAQRVQAVEDRLMTANLTSDMQLEVKLEKAVEQFRSRKLEALRKSEARRHKRRAATAKQAIDRLERRHAAKERVRAKATTRKARTGSRARKAAAGNGEG